MPFSKKRKPLGSLKELERWFVVAFMNSWRPFLGKGIAEEILDLLPMNFNGEHSADEGCDQHTGRAQSAHILGGHDPLIY